jgi:cytochrome c556
MRKIIVSALALVAVASLAGSAFAHDDHSPASVAKETAGTRHGLFHVIGAAFGPTGGMISNKAPFDAAQAQLAGARLEVLGGMIKQLTATDTSKLVPNSEAKPNIWTERADFEAKADNLVKAATALKIAAAKGDKDGTLKAARDVGGACKSCHDKFRKEEDAHDHG